MYGKEQSLPSYHPENTTISSKRASNTVVTLNDRTGKSSPIVYEAEKLSWPAIIWLFTEGKPLPVTTGKIEISINDPVTALAVALIDTNGDINVTDMSGKTPLMNAAIEGKEEVVEALLDSGADPSMVDPRGKSVVEYYAKKRKKFFGSITTTYGKKKIKKELDRLFKSLRNFAENEGDVENDGVVERLLAAGVDVNLADSNGETALIWAVRESNDKIVDDLIKTGADVNTKDKDQRSPLMIAVENNKHYITERLLDAGGDVNLVDRNGETALTLAIKKGYEKSVNALILAGADINAKDKYEQTPLISAVENNNENIAEILLDAGADPFAIANVRGRHLGF
ncbi:putative ankyrin repeat protein MM-0045 [Exaiptasia diaphana]|nr:putative ankyrin repeat protein MM-0045 [Exaiptasia diaphana]